ncbi:YegP family protein [Arthrobacter sp. Hor0625]|uniref:YegP family protein n=1 Tax=Arthrobacter sp. Hor0625 TaxID=3457358 RepID=UPI00403EDC6F
MAGYFELVDAPDGGYRIRMMDAAGGLMAVSVTFPTKRAAVAGIAQAREIAGTGLVRDRSGDGQPAVMAAMAKRRTSGAGRVSTLSGGTLAATKRTRAHH